MKPENIPALAERLADIRILREHHVWAAAEIFGLDGLDEPSRQTLRKFRVLMEADALVEAVLLLAATATPPRSVERINARSGRWVCSMHYAEGNTSRTCSAAHADLAAAVLASLLASLEQPAALRHRRTPLSSSKIGQHRHDLTSPKH
ncbi:hypothetical protein [Aminobacter sp. HY435]|uniref:hypothetical protein n=1 Tax=Aminobacter sp. HY435 TaxID=2970917 RepID=UPI0022B96CDA|nr:hypothetical protein [Aminobacter sp. HY435]